MSRNQERPTQVLLEEDDQLLVANQPRLRPWLPGRLVCRDRDSPFYGFNYAAEHFTFSRSRIAAFIISLSLAETSLPAARNSVQEGIRATRDQDFRSRGTTRSLGARNVHWQKGLERGTLSTG